MMQQRKINKKNKNEMETENIKDSQAKNYNIVEQQKKREKI